MPRSYRSARSWTRSTFPSSAPFSARGPPRSAAGDRLPHRARPGRERDLSPVRRRSHARRAPGAPRGFLGAWFSDAPEAFSYSLEDHAKTVATLLDRLALAQSTVIAYSFGGAV